jgi:hypothetical protein
LFYFRFGFIEDKLNAKRSSEIVSSIPYQNVMLDAFQILRVETNLVSEACRDVYCGSGTNPNCTLIDEFYRFNSSSETYEDYEKILDNLISDVVSSTFSEFRLDTSLPTVKKKDKEKYWTCLSKARDFFLLEDLKSNFPKPISKSKFYPGSLLRWIYVHSGRYCC